MEQEIDINVKQLYKQNFQNLQQSQLVLEFSGETINSSLINGFRRLSMDYVPTYSFSDRTITIEKNTSIFNNDYMRLRLSQLTIPNINIPINYLDEKYWKNIDYNNPSREKHPDDKSMTEFYINATNVTTENINVTTNESSLFVDGVQVTDKFNSEFPLLLIQLRPNETFVCKCLNVLGVGKNNNIWAAAGNCWFEEIKPKKYKFTMESQGQLDEYDILLKSCSIIREKISNIKKIVLDKYMTPNIDELTQLKIILENEDHTISNIINEYLQENDQISYSGLSKPDPLVDRMVITISSLNKNPLKPFLETLDYINSISSNLEKQFQKISKNININQTNKVSKKKEIGKRTAKK